jgi:hypothetical protein
MQTQKNTIPCTTQTHKYITPTSSHDANKKEHNFMHGTHTKHKTRIPEKEGAVEGGRVG